MPPMASIEAIVRRRENNSGLQERLSHNTKSNRARARVAVTNNECLIRIRKLADKPRRTHLISVELQIIVTRMAVKF